MIHDLTVLYVEDEEITRESFTEIFSLYFKNIITASDGEKGLELYKNNKIDIAILDISVPKINGLDLAKIIHQNNSEIEIIMITGHSEKEKLLQAINLHLCSYLIKPVKKDELNNVLNRVIAKLSKNAKIDLLNGYEYNTQEKLLFYKNHQIKISKNERKLLNFLCGETKTYHSACDISNSIFSLEKEDNFICNNIIQLISRFKKKMLKFHHKDYFFIDNIYGLGYKLQNTG